MRADQWQRLAEAFAGQAGDIEACRLCRVCIDVLAVAGAGVTLMDGDQVGPLCVSGPGAAALEELQFTLGEGPCHDAYRSGQPVRIVRLDKNAPVRWLPFAELAVRSGIGAVFAYPLLCDGAKLGVLTLYERDPGDLSETQHDLCLGLADVLAATIAAMSSAGPNGELVGAVNDAFAFRAEIHQASGMVAAQLDVAASEALLRIRAHAFAAGRPVADIATDIIGRRLRLDDDRDHQLGEEAES